MSLDPQHSIEVIAQRFRVSFGLAASVASTLARAAIDEILREHGGERHYIPRRCVDKQAIVRDHGAGVSVEAISRRHGVSVSTVRRLLNGQARRATAPERATKALSTD